MLKSKKQTLESGINANDEGVAALEFAFIAPILLVMIMGIVEFGLIQFARNIIENATAEAARAGITNSTYNSGSRLGVNNNPADEPLDRVEVIRRVVRDRSSGLLDEDNLSISCESFGPTFGTINSLNLTNPGNPDAVSDESCEGGGLGVGDEAVIYNVAYRWNYVTPLAALIDGLVSIVVKTFEI